MKQEVEKITQEYLNVFPNEKKRLSGFLDYLQSTNDEELVDWNNADGHLTVGAFVYCAKEDKFLVLYHKDLQMYLYPGGHGDKKDTCPLDIARRELTEETGFDNLDLIPLCHFGVPFDIDVHEIPYNERVGMPSHWHFDFRYLFLIDKTRNVKLDDREFKNYKWVSSEELRKDKNFGNVVDKIEAFL